MPGPERREDQDVEQIGKEQIPLEDGDGPHDDKRIR